MATSAALCRRRRNIERPDRSGSARSSGRSANEQRLDARRKLWSDLRAAPRPDAGRLGRVVIGRIPREKPADLRGAPLRLGAGQIALAEKIFAPRTDRRAMNRDVFAADDADDDGVDADRDQRRIVICGADDAARRDRRLDEDVRRQRLVAQARCEEKRDALENILGRVRRVTTKVFDRQPGDGTRRALGQAGARGRVDRKYGCDVSHDAGRPLKGFSRSTLLTWATRLHAGAAIESMASALACLPS